MESGLKSGGGKNTAGLESLVVVEFNDDATECYVSLRPEADPGSLHAEQLMQHLAGLGIQPQQIMESAVESFCRSAAENRHEGRTLVAWGSPATTGEDGWLELLVSTSIDEAHYEMDDRGNIDYRSRHAIANVEPGMLVGMLHTPTEGEPGQTVRGEIIPARLGRPRECMTGKGVVFDADGHSLRADAPGRLLFDGTTLSVSDEFTVDGDLNMRVGNIEFSGFVGVRGDIYDDFSIKATKGIQVGGVVGACRLEAGGDVILTSMFGKESGSIRCTGNLRARLLNGVMVECHGDVFVSGEIRDCTIKCLGAVIAPTAIISGGKVTALAGVEAKEIGARSGIRTTIRAGVNFLDPDSRRLYRQRLSVVESKAASIREAITALENQRDKLDPELIDAKLGNRRRELDQHILEKEIIEEELRFFEHEKKYEPNAKINIGTTLHEGAIICLAGEEFAVMEDQRGKASIIKDPCQQGKIARLPHTRLKINARELAARMKNKTGGRRR